MFHRYTQKTPSDDNSFRLVVLIKAITAVL